ncbi:glycosyltransferase [Hydrogenophaga sp.]|uniref:glycosyltransferase n=1 Tax=Hydrogenophaga sp. TaxID=1904254 RepID=UPI0025C4E4B9|nr:glycosyltransferase [Hydrogenophaga sp.]
MENYMRDAMVALSRRGVHCMAVVHCHWRSWRSLDEVVDAGGSAFHVIRAGTWFRLMYAPISPMFPVLLRRFLRRYRPDVLHLHMPNPSAFWALALPSARAVPWVIHWHADVVASTHDRRLRWFYRIYRPLEQALLRRARAVVVTSQAYLDFSEPLRGHRQKCQVVPLGLDPGRLAPNARHAAIAARRGGELRVLAIGRLTYYKGFGFLVEAAARVPGVRVDLVGAGDQYRKLAAQVQRRGVSDRVVLHGALPDVELRALLEQCDCVCLPSIERTEAFGMVLLEAMLHGKPVVVGDVPGSGMGFVVEDGDAGLKVEPANSAALAAALQRLRDDPAGAEAMGRRGRERFERLFHIDRSAARLEDIYRQVATAPSEV